jgi:GT2 family glycosyltransferase
MQDRSRIAGRCGRVNLPAACFNQYNVGVSPSPFHWPGADFARVISQKFERGRFLVVGADPGKLERQFTEIGREAVVIGSGAQIAAKLSRDAEATRFEIALWFYSSEKRDDDRMVEELSRCADEIVLIPGAGVDVADRRPQLVEKFGRFRLLPDYECDLGEIHAGALRLRHWPDKTADALLPGMETAFVRLNERLSELQRSLGDRASELEVAHRHIAALEEKLLKLKQYQRELKLLKEQKQTLRKSPERRIGQVLLAPYRIPEKLVKATRKKLWPRGGGSKRSVARTQYQEWFQRHRASAGDLDRMRQEARAFAFQPLISVITPVFDTSVPWLEEALESVLAQAYENWELLLIDDGSSASDLLNALPALAARDRRITLARVGKHKGISAASNQGLGLARGEWVTFLDHDDVLEPDALFQILRLLQTHPDADLIYSDEDKLAETGFDAPLFKPDWSPDFLLSYNYIGHLTAIRRKIVQKVGGFRSEFDGAQDYDLFLRVIEQTDRIHHIPRVLYHWRRSEASSAISVRQKPGQLEASRFAIESHLKRRHERAHVAVDWRTHAFCVRRELLAARKISIIIPIRSEPEQLTLGIESLMRATRYPNYEIIIVGSEDMPDKGSDYLPGVAHRLLRFSGEFHDSAVRNFVIKQTDSPWLLFVDGNIEVIEPDWLTIMAEHIQRPQVGAVGGRLLNPTDTIEHAGFVLGVNGIAQAAFRGFPAEHPGANRQLQVTRNCSAVSGGCMLTRRDVLQEVDGFDESLPESLADVDLCLKMQRAGYLIVYTPFAKLYWQARRHDKIDPRGDAIMHERWPEVLQRDPYYNPNLSRERADFSLGK